LENYQRALCVPLRLGKTREALFAAKERRELKGEENILDTTGRDRRCGVVTKSQTFCLHPDLYPYHFCALCVPLRLGKPREELFAAKERRELKVTKVRLFVCALIFIDIIFCALCVPLRLGKTREALFAAKERRELKGEEKILDTASRGNQQSASDNFDPVS